MRIEHTGGQRVDVAAPAGHVLAVLCDHAEVHDLVRGLVDATSTPTRWVMGRVDLGIVHLRPAVDVTLAPAGESVEIVGEPAPGHTPAWLAVTLQVRPEGAHSRISSRWRVALDLPGPQLLAVTARPLLEHGARRVEAQLATRLADRFAG